MNLSMGTAAGVACMLFASLGQAAAECAQFGSFRYFMSATSNKEISLQWNQSPFDFANLEYKFRVYTNGMLQHLDVATVGTREGDVHHGGQGYFVHYLDLSTKQEFAGFDNADATIQIRIDVRATVEGASSPNYFREQNCPNTLRNGFSIVPTLTIDHDIITGALFFPSTSPTYAPTVPSAAPSFSPTQKPTISPTPPTPAPTSFPTAYVFAPVENIFVESHDCVRDLSVTWLMPSDYNENPDDFWGFRVVISDNTTGYEVERYYSLEDTYDGSTAGIILCEDELTGTQSTAAPTKPFGPSLYWSQSLPAAGTESAIAASVEYGSTFIIRVDSVNNEGLFVNNPFYRSISYSGSDCEEYSKDVCCPAYDGIEYDCDGVIVSNCPVEHTPPKLYDTPAKMQCGWGTQYVPTPPDRPPFVPPPTESPTLSPTNLSKQYCYCVEVTDSPTPLEEQIPTISPTPYPTSCMAEDDFVDLRCGRVNGDSVVLHAFSPTSSDVVYEFCQLCEEDQRHSEDEELPIPGAVPHIYMEVSECLLDVRLMWDVPDDFYDNWETYWGWMIEVSDRNGHLAISRYYSLEETNFDSYIGIYRKLPEVYLCQDEVTGTANVAAPNKEYGHGLYWSGSFPAEAMDAVSSWSYGSAFSVKIYGINRAGMQSRAVGTVGALRLNVDDKGCQSHTVDPEDSNILYNPPKFYNANLKEKCGWHSLDPVPFGRTTPPFAFVDLEGTIGTEPVMPSQKEFLEGCEFHAIPSKASWTR
jgi:hypothetical protein